MIKYFLIFCLMIFHYFAAAQNLLDILEEEQQNSLTNKTTAIFKGSRIVNVQSIENRSKGSLELIIAHRFGQITGGTYELFGIDQANMRIALEYVPIQGLTLGFGRSSLRKTYDGFLKYRILSQQTGKTNIPFSVAVFSSINAETVKTYIAELDYKVYTKLSYSYQLLLARKFSPGFSLQITPTIVHRNYVLNVSDNHDIYALGAGSRIKVTNRMSVNLEYHYVFNPIKSYNTFNSMAIGFDIETGGHVFQLHFSNAQSMLEKGFITETTSDFTKGEIHFGFNITRTFQIKH